LRFSERSTPWIGIALCDRRNVEMQGAVVGNVWINGLDVLG
jgi:hypothetical protein